MPLTALSPKCIECTVTEILKCIECTVTEIQAKAAAGSVTGHDADDRCAGPYARETAPSRPMLSIG